jgi:phosphomannomutase
MNQKEEIIFSVSGLRGIVGRGLYPHTVIEYSYAFGELLQAKKILVATDTRNTKDMIKYAVFSALLSLGIDITDIGIAPTPTAQYIVEKHNFDGGIVITASHNPPEWNALKFIKSDGTFLSENDTHKIETLLNQKKYHWQDYKAIGKIVSQKELIENYIDDILTIIDLKAIRDSRLKVLVDAGNGAGAIVDRRLLEKLGVKNQIINEETDGKFRRQLEPTKEALLPLGVKVKEYRANIGFAQDTDADRLLVIDENGNVLSEEYTLPIAAYHYLSYDKGDIVVNLSTSRLIEYIAKLYGVRVYRAKVGEINVVNMMKEIGAKIGGEGNGGVILPKFHYGRDSFVGIVLILELIAHSKKTISELISTFPKYYMLKEKVKINTKDIEFDDIKREYQKGAININTSDGIRIDYEDVWFHIRKSNTEPIIRIIVEGEDKSKTKNLLEELKTYIKERYG